MMNTDGSVLRVEDLEKVYRQQGTEVPALRRISLSVMCGEFVAIMGRSGSGKSTLLHLVAGIDTSTRGMIAIHGQKLTCMTEAQRAKFRRREIGLVFQSFNLLSNLTVLQNVMLPGLLLGGSQQVVRTRALQMLEELHIVHLARRLPAELSGGQQQRTAIARALINEPVVLLADEPTGNLDSQTGEEVLKLIEKYHASGQTILLATHDLDVAGRASRVITLSDGQIVEADSSPIAVSLAKKYEQ